MVTDILVACTAAGRHCPGAPNEPETCKGKLPCWSTSVHHSHSHSRSLTLTHTHTHTHTHTTPSSVQTTRHAAHTVTGHRCSMCHRCSTGHRCSPDLDCTLQQLNMRSPLPTTLLSRSAALGSRPSRDGTRTASCQLDSLSAAFAQAMGWRSTCTMSMHILTRILIHKLTHTWTHI